MKSDGSRANKVGDWEKVVHKIGDGQIIGVVEADNMLAERRIPKDGSESEVTGPAENVLECLRFWNRISTHVNTTQ